MLTSASSSGRQMLEREMAVREKEVEAIQAQAKALAQEDQGAGEVERTSRAVEEKFVVFLSNSCCRQAWSPYSQEGWSARFPVLVSHYF